MNTLHTTMANNIGQIEVSLADEEIKRVEKAVPGTKWRKDFSEEMVVEDESDDMMENPCTLKPNHCWIVRDNRGCHNCGHHYMNHKACDSLKPCKNGSEWREF